MSGGGAESGARGAVPSWAVAVLVVAAAVAPYLPGLPGEFVYDDGRLIEENDGLRRPFHPGRAFLRDYYASDLDRMGLGYYRPLAVLSNEMDFRRGGGGASAFHATNLVLHAACSLLVLALGTAVLGAGPAAAAALLFAVHPAHAESVAFISGRVDPLATLFVLAALLLHLRGNRSQRSAPWRAAAGAAWLAALLSKEMGVTAPALAFLLESAIEGLPARGAWRERARRYVPYAVALAAYLVLRAVGLGGLLGPTPPGTEFSAGRPFVVLGSYLAWLVLPPPGLHLEPEPAVGAGAALAALALGATVAGAIVLAWKGARREAALAAWCVVSLLPVAQLRPIETALSERFLYLPSAGAALLLASLAFRPTSRRLRAAALAALALLGAAYVAILVPRSVAWRSAISLWTEKGEEDPGSIKAWLNLGRAHARAGNREEARAAYERAKGLGVDAEMVEGEIASLLGSDDPDQRIRAVRAALARTPGDGALWHNLGFFLLERGEAREALAAFAEAGRLVPGRPETWLGAAMANLRLGDAAAAREDAARALRLKPDLGLARGLLAECELRAGNPCEAARLVEGLELDEPLEREQLARVAERARAGCAPPR